MASQSKGLQVDELIKEVAVIKNIGTTLIYTTSDKAEIELRNFKEAMSKKFSFYTPLSILISALVTLGSTDFKDFIVSKATWNALYILVALISCIATIYTIFSSIKYRRKTDINYVIAQLKKEE